MKLIIFSKTGDVFSESKEFVDEYEIDSFAGLYSIHPYQKDVDVYLFKPLEINFINANFFLNNNNKPPPFFSYIDEFQKTLNLIIADTCIVAIHWGGFDDEDLGEKYCSVLGQYISNAEFEINITVTHYSGKYDREMDTIEKMIERIKKRLGNNDQSSQITPEQIYEKKYNLLKKLWRLSHYCQKDNDEVTGISIDNDRILNYVEEKYGHDLSSIIKETIESLREKPKNCKTDQSTFEHEITAKLKKLREIMDEIIIQETKQSSY